MSDDPKKSNKAFRFGGNRAQSLHRPPITKRHRVADDSPASFPVTAKPPNLALLNPFAPRAWRNRPRAAQKSAEEGCELPESWGLDDDPGYDHQVGHSEVRIRPQHAKSTQDELWQRAREPLVKQYYESVQQQQDQLIETIQDRVARIGAAPKTCSQCTVGTQPVLFVGLEAAVEAAVTFSHCPRCVVRPSDVFWCYCRSCCSRVQPLSSAR